MRLEVCLLLILWASLALADIPPANTESCSSKEAGQSCKMDDGAAGECAPAKCTKSDYSNGPPPTYIEVDCMKCEPKGAGAGDAAPSGARCDAMQIAPAASGLLGLMLLGWARRRRE